MGLVFSTAGEKPLDVFCLLSSLPGQLFLLLLNMLPPYPLCSGPPIRGVTLCSPIVCLDVHFGVCSTTWLLMFMFPCLYSLASQAAMALMSLRNTHRVIDGLMVLTLYPLSLMVVAGLEALGWD